MMRPQLRAFIAGRASRMVWKAAERFSAITASQRSDGNASNGATCWMPALLTRMSTLPWAAHWLINASMSAGRVRSPPSNSTLTPNSSVSPARRRSIAAASPKPLITR